MRLLLVEDNARLAGAIVDLLSLEGHGVDHAETLEKAGEFCAAVAYDLVLLDIMLPDGDGRTFLRELRTAEPDLPVIVLTARSEVSDRVNVLDLGADDYIVKPFDFSELEARIRAVLRRRGKTTASVQSIGDIEFDLLGGALTSKGTRYELRNRELRLFEVFAANPGIILSKTKLVDRLFSADEDVSENAIEVYVGRLRKHLKGSRVAIETVRGLGYKLSVV